MLDKELLKKALEIETRECEEEIKREEKLFNEKGEIVFVPVIVKEHEEKIGALTHSDFMKTYNRLVRDKED
ncbi:hypothetical protein UT300003_32560 [Clostridium sardiniense]